MSSEYKLTKFTSVGSRVGNYFISFNKSGLILSSGFYLREGIKNFSRVVLYFDKNKKAIAIQFSKDNNVEGGFTLVHSNNRTTGSVSARSFILTHGLNDPKYFGRFVPQKINYEEAGELFVIDLPTGDQVKNEATPSADASIEEALPQ